MKDWIFFPIMALIGALMVYMALYWGEGPEPINPEEGYLVKGPELQYLVKSPGTSSELMGVDYVVMSASFKADEEPSQGVFTTLGAEFAKAYEGRKLELIIRARAGSERPAKSFQIAFLTVPPVNGSFTWREFTPSPEFIDHKIPITLGKFPSDEAVMYLGIWPDADGDRRTIEVERYEVRLIE